MFLIIKFKIISADALFLCSSFFVFCFFFCSGICFLWFSYFFFVFVVVFVVFFVSFLLQCDKSLLVYFLSCQTRQMKQVISFISRTKLFVHFGIKT